jgi:hypothetical protein
MWSTSCFHCTKRKSHKNYTSHQFSTFFWQYRWNWLLFQTKSGVMRTKMASDILWEIQTCAIPNYHPSGKHLCHPCLTFFAITSFLPLTFSPTSLWVPVIDLILSTDPQSQIIYDSSGLLSGSLWMTVTKLTGKGERKEQHKCHLEGGNIFNTV